jgi:transposase-like protein
MASHERATGPGAMASAVEMPARGLSVRDIEDAVRGDDRRLPLSRPPVSELGERLWRDCRAFATRDLGEHGIVHLC